MTDDHKAKTDVLEGDGQWYCQAEACLSHIHALPMPILLTLDDRLCRRRH